MTKKSLALFVGVALLAVAIAVPALAAKEGDPVPEITLNMLSGTELKLKEFAAKNPTVVIAFIQTACTSCRGEIAELQTLVNSGKGKVAVLPVFVDMRGGKAFLDGYKAENKITFDFALDPQFSVPKLFGMSYTPGTIIIKDSKVTSILKGYDDEIKKTLEKLFE
jgi:peroxiredoxin